MASQEAELLTEMLAEEVECRCGLPKGVRIPKPDDFIIPCEKAEDYVKDSHIKQNLYHGSSAIDKIINEGFRIEVPRTRDPGDFGWGIYLSDSISRAFAAGGKDIRPGKERVVATKVKVKNPLVLKCPYSICEKPETSGDQLIWELRRKYGDTVRGLTEDESERLYNEGKTGEEIYQIAMTKRTQAAKKWAEEIQKAGYDAVIWERGEVYPGGPVEHEVVIFDPSKIKIIGSKCDA